MYCAAVSLFLIHISFWKHKNSSKRIAQTRREQEHKLSWDYLCINIHICIRLLYIGISYKKNVVLSQLLGKFIYWRNTIYSVIFKRITKENLSAFFGSNLRKKNLICFYVIWDILSCIYSLFSGLYI